MAAVPFRWAAPWHFGPTRLAGIKAKPRSIWLLTKSRNGRVCSPNGASSASIIAARPAALRENHFENLLWLDPSPTWMGLALRQSAAGAKASQRHAAPPFLLRSERLDKGDR
jgi:hypothetical protein